MRDGQFQIFGGNVGEGGHDGGVRRAWLIVVGSLLLALCGVGFAAVEGAAATSCAATITISGPSSGKLVLSPARVKAQVGGCVAFANSTSSPVSVTVTAAGKTVYFATVSKGETTPGKSSYAPKAAGHDSVFAASTPLPLLKVKGSGSITVSPSPSGSPSATASPTPSGKRSTVLSVHPDVAPSPKKSKHTPRPRPTGIKLPPLPPLPTTAITALPLGTNPVVAPFLPTNTAAPSTESPSPVAAIVGGPLEPVENNRRGLPEAVAVLVVLGLASGWGRVILALPKAVDDKPRPDHRI